MKSALYGLALNYSLGDLLVLEVPPVHLNLEVPNWWKKKATHFSPSV